MTKGLRSISKSRALEPEIPWKSLLPSWADTPSICNQANLEFGTRETIADVTRTLACFHAIIAARVFDHNLLEQMEALDVRPVLNMLSETDHPLQALADLMTIEQLLGHLEGARVTFIGEGNNVSRSLAEACRLVGAEFTIASPTNYGFDGSLAGVREIRDPAEAVTNADIIYSDVWVSMGGEDSDDRRKAFEPYQVNDSLMANAPGAWFMHCLPAHRGEEVTASVIDGNRSAVWRQAENRLHSARGTMLWMLDQTL